MNTNGWYPTYRAMTLKQANGSWLQTGLKPNTAYVGDLISTALTWEKVRTWNIGLDWGLFNNRLTCLLYTSLCADFHAGFCLLKQKVLLVESNSFPKENSQFLLLKLLF